LKKHIDVRLESGKLTWQWKTQPLEDVSPITDGDFPACPKHLSTNYFVEPRTFDDDPMAAILAVKCIEERSFNTH